MAESTFAQCSAHLILTADQITFPVKIIALGLRFILSQRFAPLLNLGRLWLLAKQIVEETFHNIVIAGQGNEDCCLILVFDAHNFDFPKHLLSFGEGLA